MLTTKQAADFLDLSKSTVDKLRMSGRGPVFYKIGRKVRYGTDDLSQWLAARRRTSTWGQRLSDGRSA